MSAHINPWRGTMAAFASNWHFVGFRRAAWILLTVSSHMRLRRWLYWDSPQAVRRLYRRWRIAP